jgi:hypothetical protein
LPYLIGVEPILNGARCGGFVISGVLKNVVLRTIEKHTENMASFKNNRKEV